MAGVDSRYPGDERGIAGVESCKSIFFGVEGRRGRRIARIAKIGEP
jgi:hypothetical protein